MPASPVSISPTQSKSSGLTITHGVLRAKRRWPSLHRAPRAPARGAKPDGAQAGVPSDAQGGKPQRSDSLLARAAAWVLACLLACFGFVPPAQAQCTDLKVTVSPSISNINVSSSGTGTVWSGSVTVTGTGCPAAGHYLSVPIGSVAQATTVSGISVVRTGSPTYAVLSGTCSVHWATTSGWTTTDASSGGFAGSSGVCSTSMTVNFSFLKPAAGAVSGTISPTKLLASANTVFGVGMTAWAGTIDFGGYNSGFQVLTPISLYPPAITFNTLGCTLSTSTTSVILPTVAPTALATAGATAGRKPFTLTLTGCTYPGAAYSAIATWAFAPAYSSSIIGNSAASPKAANVGVQLLDSNLTPLTDGGSTVLASVSAAGSYSKTFYAQYIATGVGGAGNVAAQATFTLTYQ